jgi:hypothetical protein
MKVNRRVVVGGKEYWTKADVIEETSRDLIGKKGRESMISSKSTGKKTQEQTPHSVKTGPMI